MSQINSYANLNDEILEKIEAGQLALGFPRRNESDLLGIHNEAQTGISGNNDLAKFIPYVAYSLNPLETTTLVSSGTTSSLNSILYFHEFHIFIWFLKMGEK